MNAIRYLSWLLRAVLFLLLLLFALKNTEVVTLRFFFAESWQFPLVLLLLIFFTFGAVTGVLACISRMMRERRDILALRKEVRRLSDANVPGPSASEPPPTMGG